MIHQISNKLRQQIHGFSGELSTGLMKVASRFVEEMIYGISKSQSVRLTEVGRALEEPMRLHATHKRLSSNLANEKLELVLGARVLEMGSRLIGADSLLIVDPSDLIKKYARQMEYLAEVRDGSEKKIGRGYWMIDVVGAEVDSSRIVPLVQHLYSQEAPDFVSENDEILSQVGRVLEATDYKGVVVFDRGGDRRELYREWVADSRIEFIIRQRGDRHLLYKRQSRSTLALAEQCKTPYGCTIIREKEGKERVDFIHYGFVPVRLPEHPDRQLYLVVVKGLGETPLMLLTTRPMRRNRKVLWWVVSAYLTRWRIEETIRFIKQSYDLEDVRVLTYQRLRNMATLVLAVSFFVAVWLGTKVKMKILASHLLNAAKRLFGIPDFRYYALADGIRAILNRSGKGPLHESSGSSPPDPQLALFAF